MADNTGMPRAERGYTSTMTGWWSTDDGEDTPELRWPQCIEIYGEMRRQDAQVMSVLRAVTLPIRRTAWRIEPDGAADEVVEFVADNLGLPIKGQETRPVLRARDRFSWTNHLQHALTMLPFGHAFFEQVYRIDDQGMARLRRLAWRPPRTIAKVDVAADGGLVAIEQWGVGVKNSPPRITVDALVAYVHDREGGNWLGQSLLRPAYKFWLLKDRALRTQSLTLDRNGLGVPVYTAGTLPEGLTGEAAQKHQDAELAAGLATAKGLRSGESAGAAVPNGGDLSMKGVGGTLPDADPVIRYYDEQIARAVLAHFLNLGTETGSWALGSTFADFFTMSLQSYAEAIRDVTQQHVIEDLVDINFGAHAPAPKLVFDEVGSNTPLTAEAIRALIDCGALTADAQLEEHIRDRNDLPAHDPETARQRTPKPTPKEGP